MSKSKILFLVSGSIAAYKACSVVSRLVQDGHEVRVAATASALKFIGDTTFEGLTGHPVLSDVFERGQNMQHIHLAKWADLTILCPASANTVNKFAAGIGDDLVTTLFLAHDFVKPFLIAPAMNTKMYQHPVTQEALRKLSAWGVAVLETGAGSLACGDVGEGRLLEPEQIHSAILGKLQARPSGIFQDGTETVQSQTARSNHGEPTPVARPLKILITSGGTKEPIDGVRSITNLSSGKTGAVLAETLGEFGHAITFVCAEGSAHPGMVAKSRSFVTFADLDQVLRDELASHPYDAVIQLAAVSDFSVAEVQSNGKKIEPAEEKIESRSDLVLKLTPNFKIVEKLRAYAANPGLVVVAFKLTNSKDPATRTAAIAKLERSARPNFIVHNDLSDISAHRHAFRVISHGTLLAECEMKEELPFILDSLLREHMNSLAGISSAKDGSL